MKLAREYHFNPVLKTPVKVILERDFLWLEVYFKDRLVGKLDQKQMKKGAVLSDEEVGEIFLKRTKKNPPQFEIKVNDYYSDDSENHPLSRMRSASMFFAVVTLLGLTGNINLMVNYFPFPFSYSVAVVFFLSGILLLFRQIYVLPIAGFIFIAQQLSCFQYFYFDSRAELWLQIIFDVIFIFWWIREWKTVKDTLKHFKKKSLYEDSEVLDV